MKLDIYQIDAFAEQPFEGNRAAVVPLEKWLPDATMQAIAEENSLAETAFFVPSNRGFHIRWFTPNTEVLAAKAERASSQLSWCVGRQCQIKTRGGASRPAD